MIEVYKILTRKYDSLILLNLLFHLEWELEVSHLK